MVKGAEELFGQTGGKVVPQGSPSSGEFFILVS